jgi:hypothetical protein
MKWKSLRKPQDDPRGRWSDRWGRIRHVIKPDFVSKKRFERPPSPSTVWSGFVIYRKTKETAIDSVEAIWTVPCCYPPNGAKDGDWYTVSSWIGIDGDGLGDRDRSKNILQVGVDSNVMRYGGTMTRWVSAWYEWMPSPTKWIANFEVSPGDTLECIIAMHRSSKRRGWVYMHNITSGVATSFRAKTRHAEIKGNCAEWIVERCGFDGDRPRLASYGAVCFDEAKAFTEDGEEIKLVLDSERFQGRFYEMKNKKKHIVSRGQRRSDRLLRCEYVGPTAERYLAARLQQW